MNHRSEINRRPRNRISFFWRTAGAVKPLSVLLLLVVTVSITTRTAFALTFDELAVRLDATSEVRLALTSVESARKQLALLSFRGDPSVSLEPTVKGQTVQGGPFAEAVDFEGSVSAKLPVGLSDLGKERARIASDNLQTALANLDQVRSEAFVELFSKYQEAQLAQAEQNVLEAEYAAAQATESALRKLLEAGQVSLIELNRVEEDLRQSEEALLEGRMDRRISWIELALSLGLELTNETPELDAMSLDQIEPLPRPPELAAWAFANNADVAAQRLALSHIDGTLSRLAKPDLTVALRAFVNGEERSASLGYTFSSPELSASYQFPLYSTGEIDTGSGSSVQTWSTGVGFTLSYQSGTEDRLTGDTLVADRERELIRAEALETTLEIAIRSEYQKWMRSQNSLDQAQRGLERALDDERIMKTRQTMGLAAEHELPQASAAVLRAKWQQLAAEIEETEARLRAAQAASYLEQIINIR